MKRLIYQAGVAAAALLLLPIAACNEKSDGSSSTVNVEAVSFNQDTILLNKGDEVQLQVTTTPAGAPLQYMVSGNHAGYPVVSIDDGGKVKGLVGGIATVIAVAPNGEGFTEAKTTIMVDEKVTEINTGPSDVFYMFSNGSGSAESETARAMDVSTFSALPNTATDRSVKVISLDDPSNKWKFVPDNPNVLFYGERTPGVRNTGSDTHDSYSKEVARLTIGSVDGGVTKTIELRNASYLKITASSSSYTGYGYYPYGLFDSRTDVGGWHSTGNLPSSGAGHRIQVDFRESITITGVEFWRSTNDSKDVEVYTHPSTEAGITYSDADYTKYGDGTFSGNQLVIAGGTVVTRYLMFRFPNSNRGGNCNLTEIRPYIITD